MSGWVRVIVPAPALIVDVRVTVSLSLDPVACVIAPSLDVAFNAPPIVPAPKLKSPFEVTPRSPPIEVVVPNERLF